MTIVARPLYLLFGAELSGIDLRSAVGATALAGFVAAMTAFDDRRYERDMRRTTVRERDPAGA